MRNATIRVVVVALAGAVLVGCGDPNEPVVGEANPEPMHTPVDRCREADEDLVDLIQGRLDVEAELEHVHEVTSEEEDGLVFVAAELVGDELDDEAPIGTWAIRDDGSDIWSVSTPARYHSSWADGTRLDPPLTMKTNGAKEAETCVEAAAD